MFERITHELNSALRRPARLAALVATVCLATLTACEGGEGDFSTGPGPSTTDFEGVWNGTYVDSRETGSIDWDVDQTGTQVSGSATVTRTGSVPRPATVQGTSMGSALTYTIALLPPCEGTMSGTATIASDPAVPTATNFQGTYTGSDCNGAFTGGTITMCRGQGCRF